MHLLWFCRSKNKSCLITQAYLACRRCCQNSASRVSFDLPRQIGKRKETASGFEISCWACSNRKCKPQSTSMSKYDNLYWRVRTESTAADFIDQHASVKWFRPWQIQSRICPMPPALQLQRLSITRDLDLERKKKIIAEDGRAGFLNDHLHAWMTPRLR